MPRLLFCHVSADNRTIARDSSATLHACATQPRAVKGASASKISLAAIQLIDQRIHPRQLHALGAPREQAVRGPIQFNLAIARAAPSHLAEATVAHDLHFTTTGIAQL